MALSEPQWMKKNCSKTKRRKAVHSDIPYNKTNLSIPSKISVSHIALINNKNWSRSFKKKTPPDSSEWLYSQIKDRKGQTFYEWYRRCTTYKLFPNTIKNTIGLICIDEFNINILGNNLFDILSEITSIYYQMPVKIMDALSTETNNNNKITQRIRDNGCKQLLTKDIHQYLSSIIKEKNDNLYCLMGITMIDLYPRPEWNFVFGQANIPNRTGIFSFARYCHGFDDIDYLNIKSFMKNTPKSKINKIKWLKSLINGEIDEENKNDDNDTDIVTKLGWKKKKQEVFLKRCIKVLIHELGHLFGIKHCIFFECIMNGSNHLDEADGRPIHFCPICLHKIYFANYKNMDLLKRYKQLNEIYSRLNLYEQANWFKSRVQFIENKIKINQFKYGKIVTFMFRDCLNKNVVDQAIIVCIYHYCL